MMKSNILSDLGTAVRLFKDIRQARKEGKTIEVKQSLQVHCIRSAPTFLDTVEGCALAHYDWKLYEAVKEVFNTFSYDQKRMLAFAPKDGSFVERAQFWQNALKYTIEPDLYHVATFTIVQWFIHMKQMRT